MDFGSPAACRAVAARPSPENRPICSLISATALRNSVSLPASRAASEASDADRSIASRLRTSPLSGWTRAPLRKAAVSAESASDTDEVSHSAVATSGTVRSRSSRFAWIRGSTTLDHAPPSMRKAATTPAANTIRRRGVFHPDPTSGRKTRRTTRRCWCFRSRRSRAACRVTTVGCDTGSTAVSAAAPIGRSTAVAVSVPISTAVMLDRPLLPSQTRSRVSDGGLSISLCPPPWPPRLVRVHGISVISTIARCYPGDAVLDRRDGTAHRVSLAASTAGLATQSDRARPRVRQRRAIAAGSRSKCW